MCECECECLCARALHIHTQIPSTALVEELRTLCVLCVCMVMLLLRVSACAHTCLCVGACVFVCAVCVCVLVGGCVYDEPPQIMFILLLPVAQRGGRKREGNEERETGREGERERGREGQREKEGEGGRERERKKRERGMSKGEGLVCLQGGRFSLFARAHVHICMGVRQRERCVHTHTRHEGRRHMTAHAHTCTYT